MAEIITEVLNKGIYNQVNDENIPQEAASEALGWIATDDAIELSRGRILQGLEKSYTSHQKNVQYNETLAFGEEDSAGKNVKIAQKFRTVDEEDGETKQKVHGIALYKRADTGELKGTVTISIQADSSGDPSGTDLVSKTYTYEQWKNVKVGFSQTTFATETELDRETDYWIVVVSTLSNNNVHPNIAYRDSNVYSDGEIKTFNTAEGWVTLTGDFAFHILQEILEEGGVTGHHVAYKVNGDPVFFKKAGTTIQYFDENAGVYFDIITGLTKTQDLSATDHTSLAGNFVYFGSQDGLWKVSVANPQSFADMYLEAKNFKGKILIDRSRMILWDREKDRTGLYGSKIDPQDGTVYTTVSSESLGSSGAKNYSGVLAFKAGGARRTCFGLVVTANYLEDGVTKTETFTDDFSGTLTGSVGGTGTIDYMTGVYELSFANTTTTAPSADYQWEDATSGGVCDFTKSTPRVAGEGFIFRQDKGGDAIQNVLIQEGKYISLKERSTYELVLGDDDSTASNIPYRDNVGIPYWRAAVSASNGIIFMNTANPDKPLLTTLQRVSTASVLEPVSIAEQFDFSKYEWDRCCMETHNEYILFTGRTKNSATNNRLFVYHPRLNAVSVLPFKGNSLVKALGFLYIGSSVNHSVSKVLNGFDDDGSVVENFWTTRNELYESNNLKKLRRLRFRGLISKEQAIRVSISYDGDSFEEVGTILGSGSYVDRGVTYAIGTAGIGTATVGGDGAEVAYPYIIEIKLKRKPKFRGRRLKFEALNIGYASINKITDYDILTYENKLPKKYRLKQNVSLDGESVDQ